VDHVDALVVGAGVVGLAIARALALAEMEVVIAETGTLIGSGISSRNSEVIHAGIYYEPGSLKARWCVRGRQMLVAYCAERGVPHSLCGKLVVASRTADVPKLEALAARALANGTNEVQLISAAEAAAHEPALACAAALLSSASGIVDSHALMTSLLGDAETAGAMLALASPLQGARRDGAVWVCETGSDERFELAARWIINAAGLDAQAVAASIDGLPPSRIPPRFLAKGHYFSLAANGGRAPFRHLIYPMPTGGGLGVHLTLDLGGQARFGPDVEWLPEPAPGAALDYAVDSRRMAAFENEIRSYWPGLPAAALQPAYTGIRPKLSGPGAPAADFHISGPAEHGLPGLVNLFGIESPGLTASMAIGEHVVGLVQRG